MIIAKLLQYILGLFLSLNMTLTPEQEKEAAELKEKSAKLGDMYAVMRKRCLDSYFEFFCEFWDVVVPDELILNWHIKAICDKLQEYGEKVIAGEDVGDLIINVPPGMSKSTMVSVAFQPWMWLHKPDCIIISSSYGSDLSVDHSLKSKDIYKSDRYQLYFGSYIAKRHGKFMSLVKDNEKNWRNNYGGARITTSTGGSITGKHAHIILRDDPLNPEQAESSAYRNKAIRFNDRTLSNRKKDKEKVPTITVMQRLHVEDTTGHDLGKTKKEIEHIKLPATVDGDVKPVEWKRHYKDGLLDPVRLSQKVLDEQEEDLDSYGYAGQYDQEPSPGEGGKFKRAWFETMTPAELPFDMNGEVVKFMIDGAFSEKTDNDPSATMGYYVYKGKLYIRMCNSVKYKLPAYLRFARGFLNGHGYDSRSIVRVEMKSSGPAVKAMLAQEEHGGFNMSEINNLHVSWGKITRAEYVTSTVESGKVVLIKGPWNKNFVDEVVNFPNDKHDDMLDLLCYACLQEIAPSRGSTMKTQVNISRRA